MAASFSIPEELRLTYRAAKQEHVFAWADAGKVRTS
jgi:hypothetical protein